MATRTQGYVCHTHMTTTDLADYLRTHFSTGACALVYNRERIRLVPFLPTTVDTFLHDWTEGRVFNNQVELRWKMQAGLYAVLYFSERNEETRYGFQALSEGHFIVVEEEDAPHEILLWGTQHVETIEEPADASYEVWREARIPHRLSYPERCIQPRKSDTPSLKYRLYRDPDSLAVRWLRLITDKERISYATE